MNAKSSCRINLADDFLADYDIHRTFALDGTEPSFYPEPLGQPAPPQFGSKVFMKTPRYFVIA
jgi:hypothetical protein